MVSKQVIVMRKFPGLRTGKYISQGAHASVGALLSLQLAHNPGNTEIMISIKDPAVEEWLSGRFTKITVYVETEQELIDLHEKAKAANLPCALIRDAGLTEFKGVPTLTALGIGPGDVDIINLITADLPLF